jgi:hypothetical protein
MERTKGESCKEGSIAYWACDRILENVLKAIPVSL